MIVLCADVIALGPCSAIAWISRATGQTVTSMIASRLTALVGLVSLASACSGPSPEDAGTDVGVDAGHDAGHDGGRDAGIDAGRDAAFADGGWIALGDVPHSELCHLYIATPDHVAATAWPIEPCPDRGGCRRIVSPGGPPRTNPFRVERGHGVNDGSRGLFVVFGDTDGYTDEWVVDDSGHAVVGLRTTALTSGDSCTHVMYDVSTSHYGFVLLRLVQPDDISNYLYRGELGATPDLVVDMRGPFAHGSTQELRLDGLRSAAWMSFQVVQAVEADGSLSAITPGSGGGCEVADVVGDAIFAECVAPTNVFVQLPGGPLTPMFGSGLNFGLDSDGTDMVWLRYVPADGGTQAQVWAAPHTTDPAALRERHIADVPTSTGPDPQDLRVGFGYAAVLEQPDRLGVYRLTDGARAEILAPTGEYWSSFVQYIGPDEIAATSGAPLVEPLTDSQIMFIRLDSLTFAP